MFSFDETKLNLSGERFSVVYRIIGQEPEAQSKAQTICYEQTVNLSSELVPETLRENFIGRIDKFEPWADDSYQAVISYPVELVGQEFTQLLNIILGKIGLGIGIQVAELLLPKTILKNFQGPRFGRDGLRKLLKTKEGPLLAAELGPVGLSAEELAGLAYQMAKGGMDIVADNSGMTNQAFAPFEKRVKLCAQAIRRANKETGKNCLYVPNITTNYLEVRKKGDLALALGAGGLLLAPGLVGFDAMKTIAEDEQLGIPVFAHPTFQVVLHNNGISHYGLFGQLARLGGADATIFPNYSGSLVFPKEACLSIVQGTNVPMEQIKSNFPCPVGGITDNISEALQVYGNDVIFFVKEELLLHGPDIVESCRYFRKIIERH